MASYKKTAVIISAVLIFLTMASLLYLLFPHSESDGYIAEIYQEGELLFSIPLNNISENQTFTIENKTGGRNEIQVCHGSIGIVSANCPDRLCVHQGFISDSKLPITCLPNRLVIQLRPAGNAAGEDSMTSDILSY